MKALHCNHNEKGYIQLILVTIILFFCIYLGMMFGVPYYKYSAFRSDVKGLARISLGETDKTRAQIFERAAELRLPLGEDDILVTRNGQTVRVRTSWEHTVDILGFYQKTLQFNIDVEE